MVSSKDIVKIEEDVAKLRRQIRDLESDKNKYESQMRNARTKSNVGLSTMPFNLSTGASLKILGDGDYLRASSNLRTVKTELSEANKELKILERELDKLKKQWLSERKEAELIVEGDSIYIKGDDAKRDILSGVKKARQDARDVIQKIESNPKVIEYLASEADIKAKFANSPFETFKEHRSSKSKFYSKLRKLLFRKNNFCNLIKRIFYLLNKTILNNII